MATRSYQSLNSSQHLLVFYAFDAIEDMLDANRGDQNADLWMDTLPSHRVPEITETGDGERLTLQKRQTADTTSEPVKRMLLAEENCRTNLQSRNVVCSDKKE